MRSELQVSLENIEKGIASPADFIRALNLNNYNLPDIPLMMNEALARRIVWVFPDGWILSTGIGYKPFITKTDAEVLPETTPSFIRDFNATCRSMNEIDLMLSTLQALENTFGAAKLRLVIFEEWNEEYFEVESDWDEDEGAEEDAVPELSDEALLSKLAELVYSGVLRKHSPWEVSAGPADKSATISAFSTYGRFRSLLHKIKAENFMIDGTSWHEWSAFDIYESETKRNPALLGKNLLLCYQEDFSGDWFGDGSSNVSIEFYSFNDETIKQDELTVKRWAKEFGLDFGDEVTGRLDF